MGTINIGQNLPCLGRPSMLLLRNVEVWTFKDMPPLFLGCCHGLKGVGYSNNVEGWRKAGSGMAQGLVSIVDGQR